MPAAQRSIVHLRSAGVSLVVDLSSDALPAVLHWGADLGDLSDDELHALAATVAPLRHNNSVDVPVRVSVLPEGSSGWLGTPGLEGHRAGDDWSTRFATTTYEVDEASAAVTARSTDADAGLAIEIVLRLTASGLVMARATLTNTEEAAYELGRLSLALPVPQAATEILDQAGRWSKERVPQRRAITVGTHLRENRRGRTGADAATVLTAGAPGFGFRSGETWGLHVGFSGNHVSALERVNSGSTVLWGGELLLPGEVSLASGERYSTPWLFFAYGDGLDAQAKRFHDWLRQRPNHPHTDRPVVLNTWEAVYFRHDLPTLLELAERAAEVGVERYVLDDGWFLGRRNDNAGLGDWVVDPDVWPQGLHPLVNRVKQLGMQFGLWFEPEMVNPNSRLAREHPDWLMQTGGRLPLESRHQQVLNIGIPEAWEHVRAAISALVGEYGIDYIKWDHNRDLVDAGSTRTHRAGVHEQTLAVYRLFDALKAEHPGLEIESCSSGGARVDLGMLQHTDRVWASDCIDPLERQQIMRWTGQLLPAELIGSHVGSARSHTTGRTHDLSFRAATALFGHFGIEWNIAAITDEQRAKLAEWVRLYKRFRPLLHSGTLVRVDHPVDELWVQGVVAADASEALFSFAMLGRPSAWPPGLVRIPGLDPDRRYTVRAVGPGAAAMPDPGAPSWQTDDAGDPANTLTGRTLAAVGIQSPPLQPEHAALVHLTAL